jgi:hypothetical protein
LNIILARFIARILSQVSFLEIGTNTEAFRGLDVDLTSLGLVIVGMESHPRLGQLQN